MATDPWTRACNKFMEDLTVEEKKLFTSASPQNLLVGAQAAYEKYDSTSKLRAAEKTLAPLVAVISEYGSALDVFSNAYSLILSPLWGSIRVVLQIAENTTKYFEKLVTMFGRIGDVLPRFNIYERLFSDHERLLETLSVAYLDIINFCQDAKSTFRNRGLLFKGVHWQPFKQRFQKTMDNLREHVKNVDKEAGLAHMIEAATSRDLIDASKAIEESRRKDHRRLQLLARLSSVPYAEMHRKVQRLRCPGTCGWILDERLYQAWHQSQSSTVLCLYGPPGFGKTILISSLIDSLPLNTLSDATAIAYYYCDYSDPQSLSTSNVIGTLVKQFLIHLPSIPDAIEKQIDRAFNYGLQRPSEQDLIDILLSTIEVFEHIFIIIDGLDSCEHVTQQALGGLIKRLAGLEGTVVRIFTASREDPNISTYLKDFPDVKLSEMSVSSDIGAYVKHSIALKVAEDQLVFRDPRLKDKVELSLVNGACGMFLWVYFQLEELCETSSDHDIIEALRQLPVGMTETYARILRRISATPRWSLLASKALKWIVCAKRPLKITELAEAIAFSPGDQQWDASKIPDARQILRSCGNLVIYDEQDQSVRLVHYTVQQHLLSDTSEDALKHFHFDKAEDDIHAGKICIAYLSFSDFGTQLVNRPPELEITRFQEALISEMPHTLDLGTLLITAWKAFRKLKSSTGTPNINLSALLPKRTPPSVTLQQKYQFLDYAINYWTSHTMNFTQVLVLWEKFKYVALYKASSFDIRPWGSSQSAGELRHMLLFRWAVQNGHMALLEVIRQTAPLNCLWQYYRHEADQGRSPLLMAMRNGHNLLLDFLWTCDPMNWPENQSRNWKVLSYFNQWLIASISQHKVRVAEWIAKELFLCCSEDDAIKATCLAMANTTENIRNFYARYILLLLETRGSILKTAFNEHNFGPLLDVSIEKGHVNVVESLLIKAKVEELENELTYPIFNNSHRYLEACERNRPEIFRALAEYSLPETPILPRGIAVNELNFGWLLDISIQNGHIDMVKFILLEAKAEELKNNLTCPVFGHSPRFLRACLSDRPDILNVLANYFIPAIPIDIGKYSGVDNLSGRRFVMDHIDLLSAGFEGTLSSALKLIRVYDDAVCVPFP